MVKFCLQCKSAFWGGQYCPICPGEIELLDAALPENKKYLAELNIDVRPKYYARSSMLLSCFKNFLRTTEKIIQLLYSCAS